MGQCYSGLNDNPLCGVDALPAPGSTVYYAPGNCYPIEFQGTPTGTCNIFSCELVNLWKDGQLLTSCSFLDTGAGTNIPSQTLQCQSDDGEDPYRYARGFIQEGVYSFVIPIQSGIDSTGSATTSTIYDVFTITHQQATVTTTPTVTVTATSTSTETDTTTVISTTVSPAQVTETTPAATVMPTTTVTPDASTVTITNTQTLIRTTDTWTFKHKTVTHTMPCPKPQPLVKSNAQAPLAAREAHVPVVAPVVPRQQEAACATSYPPSGDGPLTITAAADPSVSTSIVTDTGTTVTVAAYTTVFDAIPPDPATTTVASGTETDQVTVSAAQGTTTLTKHTATRVVRTRTHTRTVTYTTKVTPTACFKGNPRVRSPSKFEERM